MYSAILSPETDLREMLHAYLILFRLHVVLLAALVWGMSHVGGIEWLPGAQADDSAALAQPAQH
jgi:hypothetical protein